MSKTKFEYFHNHGDEEGNNSLTICFGDSDHETDHIIVTCEDTEEDAIEAVKRLNGILDQQVKEKILLFKQWYDKLSPADKCTVWPPDGSSTYGLYNQSDEDIVDKFLRRKV